MNKLVGFANILLLALNLSALGTIAYKSQFWKSETDEPLPIEELDLTPRQAEAIANRRQSFNEDWGRIGEEIQSKRGELLQAILEEAPDPQSVWPLLDELTQLQAELERGAVTQLFQERDVLTAEQRQQYLNRVGDRMRQGCGCMQGRGFGRGWQNWPGQGQAGRGRGKGWGKGRRGKQ
jgi:Spy/CpxP family protein refolding chaperone